MPTASATKKRTTTTQRAKSVTHHGKKGQPFPFEAFEKRAFPYHFKGLLEVTAIAGGTPSDAHVAEGWLKSKLASPEELIQEQIAQIMAEREVDAATATQIADKLRHLNGFKRVQEGTHRGELCIEGRQLKAALKEAGAVSVAAGKIKKRGWGETNKGIQSFLAEHVFIVEDIIPLGAKEPTTIDQRFVHTFRGNGIQYSEILENATVGFTLITDQALTDEEWAMLWLTGQQQGLGAGRSQGYGRYKVVEWRRLKG